MRIKRDRFVLTVCTGLVAAFLLPAGVWAQGGGELNLDLLLRERDPDALIESIHDEGLEAKTRARWEQLVLQQAKAATAQKGRLYPNPSLQAYINRLGQSLIPASASENIPVTFRIVEDPLPHTEAFANGPIYISTGLISLLDNESQVAFVLMHEAAHVVLSQQLNEFVEEARAEKNAGKLRMIGAVAGALLGGIGGGRGNVGRHVAEGAVIGANSAEAVIKMEEAVLRIESQIEADQFATHVLLEHGYDPREAPALMTKVAKLVHHSGPVVQLAFTDALGLEVRSAKIKDLLGGAYLPLVNRVLGGEGFRISSPRYNQLMSELKRDNGLLALASDLFLIARANLEEAAAVRTDDPLTMYGLGMLYRTVGRSPEEIARAASYLKTAMDFDEVRHRFPEAYLQYAVELLSHEDPQRYPDIQKALRGYVVLYQRSSGGTLPREMRFIYDYLDLTGDRAWIAYTVNNVSAEAPYQLTGDAKIDHGASLAAAHAPRP